MHGGYYNPEYYYLAAENIDPPSMAGLTIRNIIIFSILHHRCIDFFMCSLFRNKYRIESTRYRGYDYSLPGKYFITICTKNRKPYFGEVENGKMRLSELGNYLHNEWLKTRDIRPDMNITLDEFVVMPDHFHAIIIIGENLYNSNIDLDLVRPAMHGGSTDDSTRSTDDSTNNGGSTGDSTNPIKNNQYKNQFGPQSKNLASIIRGIKSIVSTYAKKTKQDFQWQTLYHDHIIRTNTALYRIRKYIRENPEKYIRK
jgi:REP element-mobilizing transposase RayT